MATCQLSATYPHLPWAVVTWEAEDLALAPVNSLFRSLLLVLAATLLSLLAFAFWFSMKLAAKPSKTRWNWCRIRTSRASRRKRRSSDE